MRLMPHESFLPHINGSFYIISLCEGDLTGSDRGSRIKKEGPPYS